MNSDLKQCAHVHLSGRSCGKRLYTAGGFCFQHQVGNPADGSTLCAECDAMLEVFPIRRGVTLPPVSTR